MQAGGSLSPDLPPSQACAHPILCPTAKLVSVLHCLFLSAHPALHSPTPYISASMQAPLLHTNL